MQIKEKAKKGLKHEYHVIVPAADVEAKTNAQLQRVGKNAKLKGFRPGHVPAKVLKQQYGKSVMGEVLEQTIHDASHKVINDNKLRPALQPEIKITSFEEGKDLEFDMVVENFPEVPEMDLSKVAIEKPVFEIDEKEITDGLTRLADRNKSRTAKADSAKAEKGDVVKIDFKGLKDGVAFDGGTSKNFHLELGSGQFIPGFEDQLIGSKKGDDLKVNVTFPEAYHSADLAGQPVVFEVQVHEVLATESAKVDDELAKSIGFDDLNGLRDSLKKHLSADYDSFVRNRMKKELFDQLEEICTFEVPQGMVEAEFKNIWAQLKRAQEAGDESVAGREDAELEEEYRAIAERRVRLGIFLAEYGRANKVEVGQQELMAAVVERARQFPGQEQQVVEFYRKNPNHIEELRGPLFEDKTVDLLFSKVKLNEKKYTPEELAAIDLEDESPKKASKSKAKKAAKKD